MNHVVLSIKTKSIFDWRCETIAARVFFLWSLLFNCHRSEESPSHHLCGRLNHALANSGNRASNLQFSRVFNHCAAVLLEQIEIRGAFGKSHDAFALNHDAIMFGRTHVFEAHVTFEGTLD